MNTPVILLGGGAGSGKDTLGNYIAEHYNGVCIGQADPLKWMCRDIFGFNETQLFGPSEERNRIDARFAGKDGLETWGQAESELHRSGKVVTWCEELFSSQKDRAFNRLVWWFNLNKTWAAENGGLSARFALQTLGTEWGRVLDSQIWTRKACDTAQKLLAGGWGYTRQAGLHTATGRDPNLVNITDGRFRNEFLGVRVVGGITVKTTRAKTLIASDVEAAGAKNHQSERELDNIPDHFVNFFIRNDDSLEALYAKGDYIAQKLLSPGQVVGGRR